MEYPLYFLQTEPFAGFVPQDVIRWLDGNVPDELLAEAFVIVNNHCSALMHIVGEDDVWGDQALYDWNDVEDRMISIIVDRMHEQGIPLPEKQGTHYLVAPFMVKQGYQDCNGLWRKG